MHISEIHKDLNSGSKIICTLLLLISQVMSSQSAQELFEKKETSNTNLSNMKMPFRLTIK